MKVIQDLITTIDAYGKGKKVRYCYDENGQKYTYQELKQESDALATYLMEHPLKKAPVLVIGELEKEMITTFIGLIKAGYSYIPVESHTPKERLQMIYEVAQPSGVIVAGEFQEDFLPITFSKEKLKDIFRREVSDVHLPKRNLKDDFYLIFTSGTTGKPKGVPISHENLLSFVNWEIKDFPLSQEQRFLQQAPFSFDLSVMSLYPALALGATLVPLKKAIVEDFKALFSILPQIHLNVWVSTPSFMDIVLMSEDFNEENLPDLEVFMFCGEELTKQTTEKLQRAFKKAKIYNTYGPTETTVAISQVLITPEILNENKRLPIGFIKDDTEVLIVDEKLKEVPLGEKGEILIGGPSVSRGYYQNEEKTKEAFVKLQGKRYYRTKDKGYFKDNLLMYDGRLDFQVKLHGYRLELEDIDQNLIALPLVEQACVVPKYQGDKVQSLVAFLKVSPHDFPSNFALTKALKKELGEKVMPYMVPQRFNYLEKLPLTPNGKIDRKFLMAQVNEPGGGK